MFMKPQRKPCDNVYCIIKYRFYDLVWINLRIHVLLFIVMVPHNNSCINSNICPDTKW